MFDNPLISLTVCLLGAYMVGSVPFGWLIGRAKGVDLRRVGSGNVGATNAGRVLGKRWGYLCFLLDVGKGFGPVFIVGWLLGAWRGVPSEMNQAIWLAAGLGAMLGHVFTFWLGFRGGKGVATGLGVVLGMYPYFTLAGLCAFGLWIVLVLVTRYVSVASVAAAAAFPLLIVALNWGIACSLWPLLAYAAAVAALIIVRHRSNIVRLLKGTENKIGARRT